jgi:hypothetical protein
MIISASPRRCSPDTSAFVQLGSPVDAREASGSSDASSSLAPARRLVLVVRSLVSDILVVPRPTGTVALGLSRFR